MPAREGRVYCAMACVGWERDVGRVGGAKGVNRSGKVEDQVVVDNVVGRRLLLLSRESMDQVCI